MHRWTMEILNYYRKEAGLSQEELATRLGYSMRQSINNWNKTGIPKERIEEVVRLLGIPKEEMIEAIQKDSESELKELLGVA